MAAWYHFGRTWQHARRYRHILSVLMKYGFEEAAHTMRNGVVARFGKRVLPSKVRPAHHERSRPERVRLALEELGPTFIKLGQLLSTRPDLVPPQYAQELTKLQDQVPPEPFDPIRELVESELGGPLKSFFREFDRQSISAGSIAQVHRAVLLDGTEVAVKVLRPDVVQTLGVECEILENAADWLGVAHGDSGTVDLPRMAREFTDAVSREVDMDFERRNIKRFASNFENDPTVHIPKVYDEYCTPAILTMEFIRGIKPDNAEKLRAAGLDPIQIADRGANFVLRQIFDYGVFHSDPHPGNMFMLPGNIVVPIDFGQVARLHENDRQLLAEIVLAIVDQEEHEVIRAFREADLLGPETNVNALSTDVDDLMDSYRDLPLKDIPLREVITSIFTIIREHRIRPPSQFTLMLKSLMIVESLATELDPNYDVINGLKPYARRLRLEQLDPRKIAHRLRQAMRDSVELAQQFPEDAKAIMAKVRKGEFQLRVHHQHLEQLSNTIDKSSNRISFALIIAALLIASSMLTPQKGRVLGVIDLPVLGLVGYSVAAVMGIWLLFSIVRSRHL